MPSPKLSRKNVTLCGFTLVELLVVIAVIAIIAAILFPVFASVREKARQTTCASNLRQLGLAFAQYSNDYDETLPCGWPLGLGDRWAGQLYPYVKSPGVYDCPDDSTIGKIRVLNGQTYILQPVSYAYNLDIATLPVYSLGIGGAISQLTAPGSTVLLYEITAMDGVTPSDPVSYFNVADLTTPDESNGYFSSSVFVYSASGNGTWAVNGWYNMQQATGYSGDAQQSAYFTPTNFTSPNGRHNGGSNWLACDGHVKWLLGSSVSTGYYYNSVYGPIYPTTPTSTEDEYLPDTSGIPTAAGTQAPGWTLTFSPI